MGLFNFFKKEEETNHLEKRFYDEAKTIDSTVEVVLQINGKIRDKMQLPVGKTKEELEQIALSSDKIKALTDGKQIVKIIVVPNKLVNVVVK